MALTKDQKTAQLNELVQKLKDSESVMFSQYIGLNVADVSDLRNKLIENGAEMKVAKKTLIKLAFKEAGYPDIEPDDLEGAVACIFSFEDPLSGAQTAFKFAKGHDQVKLVGGVFEGKLISKEEAMAIAQIPGRTELLTIFACMLNSPMSSFARGLKQMAEKQEAPAEEAPKEEVAAPAAEAPAAEESAPTTEEPKPDEAPAESEAPEEGSSESPESPASPESSPEDEAKAEGSDS